MSKPVTSAIVANMMMLNNHSAMRVQPWAAAAAEGQARKQKTKGYERCI
jgi:hypothetical protein